MSPGFKDQKISSRSDMFAPDSIPASLSWLSVKVYTALKQTGLNDRVKMVTSLEMSILGASYPPSASQVADAHLGVVSELVKLLVRIGEGSVWAFPHSTCICVALHWCRIAAKYSGASMSSRAARKRQAGALLPLTTSRITQLERSMHATFRQELTAYTPTRSGPLQGSVLVGV